MSSKAASIPLPPRVVHSENGRRSVVSYAEQMFSDLSAHLPQLPFVDQKFHLRSRGLVGFEELCLFLEFRGRLLDLL